MKKWLIGALTVAVVMTLGVLAAQAVGRPMAEASTKQTGTYSEAPNVIVFYLDDARVDEMQAFMPKTQKLMVNQGTTFGRMYSNNPLCCPFRATALSGQYTHNNNVLGNTPESGGGVTFFNDKKTIAPSLKKNGYQTAYIGKYLNGYNDTGKGSVPPGWDEWFVPVRKIYQYHNTVINDNGKTVKQYPQYVTDLYAKRTNQTIRKFAKQDGPFVMYVSHLAPHVALFKGEAKKPAIPPARYKGTVTPDTLPDLSRPAEPEDMSGKPTWIQNLPEPTAEKLAARDRGRLSRAEAILAVDDAVESMINTLKETKQLKNTVIMITSDNGLMQYEHNVPSGKILPYEPSAAVQLWARGPGFEAGAMRNDPVGSVDIVATIAKITRTRMPYDIDGRSILTEKGNRKMLLEAGTYLMDGVWTPDIKTRSYVAVVSSEYKYIRYWDGQEELYDMVYDRAELHSLVQERPDVVAEYREHLTKLENCKGAECRQL